MTHEYTGLGFDFDFGLGSFLGSDLGSEFESDCDQLLVMTNLARPNNHPKIWAP